MMLRGIFRFELSYQLRRPWVPLMFVVLLVVSFLMTRDAAVADALYEDHFVNAPFYIALTTVVGGLLWMLLAPVVAGEAAARDVATGMYPLVYTTSLRKSENLFGRFLAALVVNALLLLAVQLGILLAVYSPGVNAALIAPFRPASYLTAYAYIALPNAFVATALQFAVALRSGRPMAAYLGSMALVFMGFFVASILLFSRGLGTLLDPIGIRFIVEDIAHLWTTTEKQSRLLALEGIILTNRAFWIAVALVILGITYLGFHFAHRAESSRRARRARFDAAASPAPALVGITASAIVSVPRVARSFDTAMRVRQALAIAWSSFRALATSWAGLALLIGIPLLAIPVILDQMVSMGTPLTPTTGQVLKELTGPLTSELSRWVIVPLLIVFFAGELVWRERDAGMAEIGDAAPVPDWVPLSGKLLGLVLLLAALSACVMLAGIAAQTLLDYSDYQPGLYLIILFGFQLTEYVLFAVLALVVHVLANQKYVGHLLAIVAYVIILLAPMFGIEHDLFIYGAGPWWTYTEMRGLGPYVLPWLSFKAYWAAWALLLLVAARLFWVRGREGRVRERLGIAQHRLARATVGAGALALLLVLVLGGFVFYNTNVLNDYSTADEIAARQAEYERRYARYGDVVQPHVAAARLEVDIHPERRSVEVRGSYELVNRSTEPIDTIHVATTPSVETRALGFDRAAGRVLHDAELGHSIYTLDTPLMPGESMRLDFDVRHDARGFREGSVNDAVAANGTHFTNAWFPAIGYQRGRELILPSERQAHDLAARPVIARLEDARTHTDRAPGTTLDAVVSTVDGQVGVAPGALRRSWQESGRSYFHYTTDAPIGDEWAFASAQYEVHDAQWTDVAIRVLHHPEHTGHIEPVVQSLRASFEYYTREFGPYPYGHVTVLEVPGDGVGMHAEASMITHGEGVTLMNPAGGDSGLDMPYFIAAHELGHQWNVPAALVEGAPVLSESLATYYAMTLVEHSRGGDQLWRLRRFLRLPYPIAPIRRGEPLLRGLDPYMSYRWGPFALYALSVYVGEDRVNGAIRRLLDAHRPADAPLATTLDLYRELQAVTPDSLQYLLHDLFEVNTYWRMSTERVRVDSLANGEWRVTMDVRARKMVYDRTGAETEVSMDEWVPVGVFAPPQPGRTRLSAPLHLRMHRIRSGDQSITIDVPARPAFAGIDPFHVLDWEEHEEDDNLEAVAAP
ncbi:MAG TPA: hypothetical protein VFU06_05805 [Longimicrobiales bacterium]|nr:hypothetical protein [Longimicrobiales bacterium]